MLSSFFTVKSRKKGDKIKEEYIEVLRCILRRPQKFGPSFSYDLTLLNNVKKRVEDE